MPSPAQRALERLVHLGEHVEYVLQLISGDADTRITHVYGDLWSESV